MSKGIEIIIICALWSCSSQTSQSNKMIVDSITEETNVVIDSIQVESISVVDPWSRSDSVNVVVSNHFSIKIELIGEYFIYEADSDTLLLHEPLTKTIIPSNSSYSFTVSLGMDSIWYHKNRKYIFVFPAKSEQRDIVYFASLSNLGYTNKVNGELGVIPDEICIPLEVVYDSESSIIAKALKETDSIASYEAE